MRRLFIALMAVLVGAAPLAWGAEDGAAKRAAFPVEVEVNGAVYKVTAEAGGIVVRDALGKATTFPVDSGVSVSLGSVAQSVIVSSSTGEAFVRTKGGVNVHMGAGQSVCFSPTKDQRGTVVEAIKGDVTAGVRGRLTMEVSEGEKVGISPTVDDRWVQVEAIEGTISGSFAWTRAGEDTSVITLGGITSVRGTTTLVDEDGTTFALDGTDSVTMKVGQTPGTVELRVVSGDGILVTALDGTQSTLEVGQVHVTTALFAPFVLEAGAIGAFRLRPRARIRREPTFVKTEEKLPSVEKKKPGGSVAF